VSCCVRPGNLVLVGGNIRSVLLHEMSKPQPRYFVAIGDHSRYRPRTVPVPRRIPGWLARFGAASTGVVGGSRVLEINQRTDQGDHLGYMARGSRLDIRQQATQRVIAA
jgi:hypothetical protein